MPENVFKKAKDIVPFKSTNDDDLDEISRVEKESLKANPEIYARIKSAGLSSREVDEHLGLLLDFRDDYLVCQKCPGLDKCPKTNPGYALDIGRENGFLKRFYTPCSKVAMRIKRDSRYVFSDFPEEWKDADLRDVSPDVYTLLTTGEFPGDAKNIRPKSRENALLVMSQKKSDGKWFYLNGPFSRAKSYLVVCLANFFGDSKGESIAFVDTVRIIDKLRESSIKDKNAFESDMKKLLDVPFLVFDGFGNEYKSDFAFSTVLYPILESRARNDKFTVFVSDFEWKDVAAMYAMKVGAPRSNQLINLLKAKCGKVTCLETLDVY